MKMISVQRQALEDAQKSREAAVKASKVKKIGTSRVVT
jgi:hypothetical protein